ncbi:dihydrodipicolinate synthase family protein [Chitinasiproducens palmae]|uniref:4-hydroxy-tetrahydrodipicolinate synthase n=1 Tax=Chitinasiproducens palmae TaxID=1770053 RepID=A0A1H2PKD7_9BURK|nr:dihydrodipicolinate synthase family protein [Chitinasiproducens palmae]SDV46913.1 4-hydroxy-tetrahydrodipicolinate synthase [Chitinasiproducens palmae]
MMHAIDLPAGIWLPLVTPFVAGNVDVCALQGLAERAIRGGVTGLVALSTTGEAPLLNAVERATVLQAICDVAAGRVPVLAGVAGFETRAFVREIERCAHWGVAGFLVPPPAYVCPDADGLRWHFGEIARATDRQIVLYDVPHRTGVRIAPGVAESLAVYPNVSAIKACEPNGYASLGQGPLALFCGTDEAFVDCLVAGGRGGVLASANICLDFLLAVQVAFNAGNRALAIDLFDSLRPLLTLLFAAPNPAAIKAWLALDGLIRPETRAPIMGVAPALRDALAAARDALRTLRSDPGRSIASVRAASACPDSADSA